MSSLWMLRQGVGKSLILITHAWNALFSQEDVSQLNIVPLRFENDSGVLHPHHFRSNFNNDDDISQLSDQLNVSRLFNSVYDLACSVDWRTVALCGFSIYPVSIIVLIIGCSIGELASCIRNRLVASLRDIRTILGLVYHRHMGWGWNHFLGNMLDPYDIHIEMIQENLEDDVMNGGRKI